MIRSAQQDGLSLTVETCPHYLTLFAEEIPEGATAYKCAPPIREVNNRELLWAGLLDGTIHDIASDHSPSTLDLKDLDNGDFSVAWGGIASVQLSLPVVWSEARRRGIGLEQVIAWMASKPAERVGLVSKGKLALGYDADVAVFAADASFVVDAARLHHKNPLTPYQDRVLSGVVRRTFVRGWKWIIRHLTASCFAEGWSELRSYPAAVGVGSSNAASALVKHSIGATVRPAPI